MDHSADGWIDLLMRASHLDGDGHMGPYFIRRGRPEHSPGNPQNSEAKSDHGTGRVRPGPPGKAD